MKFQPLPLDYSRCDPLGRAADKCLKCALWVHNDEQTLGPRTGVQDAIPDGDGCHFVPGYLDNTSTQGPRSGPAGAQSSTTG